jgi:hypothetical protein
LSRRGKGLASPGGIPRKMIVRVTRRGIGTLAECLPSIAAEMKNHLYGIAER